MSADDAPDCPKCAEPMVLRSGRRGEFWGCPRFPRCRGARASSKPVQLALPKFKPLFPQKHAAELNFADASVLKELERTGATVPFCPDDPEERMYALRDPIGSFYGAVKTWRW